MNRRIATAITLTVLAGLLVMPAFAQTLEEAQEELTAAFNELDALKATVQRNIVMGPGMIMKTTGEFMLLREGEVVKYREETGSGPSGSNRSLTIFDGEHIYLVTEMMGRKTALRSTPGEGRNMPAQGGAKLWEALDKDYTLSLGGEERIDGETCYVIKAAPKDPELAGPSTFYFDKQLGVLRRIEMQIPDVRGVSTVNYSDFELAPDLDPGLFVFKNEEGLDVVDQSTFSAGPAEEAPTPGE